jgi:hypothetical protein
MRYETAKKEKVSAHRKRLARKGFCLRNVCEKTKTCLFFEQEKGRGRPQHGSVFPEIVSESLISNPAPASPKRYHAREKEREKERARECSNLCLSRGQRTRQETIEYNVYNSSNYMQSNTMMNILKDHRAEAFVWFSISRTTDCTLKMQFHFSCNSMLFLWQRHPEKRKFGK